jgi:hypothetical protein
MRLTTAQFRGDIDREFVAPLAAVLNGTGSMLQGGQTLAARLSEGPSSKVELVGPFRLYRMDLRRFRGRLLEHCEQTGWRALFLANGTPLATVDCLERERPPSRHLIRSDEGAMALAQALNFLSEGLRNARGRAVRREVRILEVPSLFISTLWVPWVRAGLVPLRLGAAVRPVLARMEVTEFGRTVKRLRRIHGQPVRKSPRVRTYR